ncbi:MAG: phosphate signaling complex protein PhoU [Treponema sp.]|nr:phosphate signaling complex protein PhoU [Spirochaetia bacterium]MDD6295365.1 phosphate signaling complex protein PhoU [Treponema sp.]MDD7450357.1 phosphate signaling complex protein PhoU [Treponema sp.]MDY2924938.1 phosphate signaling complex protein PhoU [Treponema sp.]MDY5682361.1 phosphate signaling complex protein PhoU [Treponema sp.]
MREKYEAELKNLNASIIKMGKMIEVAIENSVVALLGRDTATAKVIATNDDKIDDMEKDIESQCLRLLLQQQPMASDLRIITAALKMITDMERIGDHAADIADLIIELPDFSYSNMNAIAQIGSEIIKMLNDSVESYINRDFNAAKNVIAHDDVIDELYYAIKKDLVEKIKKTDQGEQILDYLLIAKYFERIGDHCTNIAEWVIFAVTGERKTER